ncbi:hypothetical protein AJ79_05637 [Helicocarpus griseus UAMH5409]|uniref:Uncharacterized protein n=1 Tax=Helicocarpus griseus UAMH5409 TaxID=1447875 RepID=A0A2B7XLK8_9EURO|nr:hypothetical protein AJ79_05637 [Helicocarpus griseus UAMH5409]
MLRLASIIATLWLLMQLVTAIPSLEELQPLPRHLWSGNSATKHVKSARAIDEAGAADAVAPSQKEEFVWASTDKPGSKAVVVSMVSFSKPEERIIALDKIDFLIESASCNAEDMSVKFIHDIVYAAVKISWDWVNFNDMHGFVVVPNTDKCGKDRQQHPWLVRKVTFDDKAKVVRMEATQSTWKKVMNSYTLDFGEVVIGDKGLVKRDIIPDLDEKFRLGIEATLPTRIFNWEVNNGPLKGNLTANCNECGTQGALIFAGHVEASLGWTGFDIDKFELSVKPEGVAANVGLELLFDAHLDFRRTSKPSQEINLLEIPISGWNIPGLFEFGPRIQLNAGYEIDYISGTASATAGITARIPDSAIAKLDLLSEDSVEVSGWAPVIETQPLQVQAQVDAEVSVYTEIALSVSLTVLDDNGFGVDLALKVPEVTATLSAGFVQDTAGFCPNEANIFGIRLDVMVGADLDLEGWREIDGDRKNLFDVDIFEKPDIYVFPQMCLAFGDVAPGYCLGGQPEEDDEDDDDDPSHFVRRRRKLPTSPIYQGLKRRQDEDTGRDPIPLGCDKSKTVKILKYPGPTDLAQNTAVPIFVPNIPCGEASEDCWPNANISVITTPAAQRAIVDQTGLLDQEKWASEHVYEANWVRDFLDYLQKKLTSSSTCHAAVLRFFEEKNPVYTPPGGAAAKKTYAEALTQELGTDNTAYEPRMAIIQQRLNNLKYLMFAKKNLVAGTDGDKGRRKVINSHGRWVCELARISATCKYYAHPEAQKALNKSIAGIEKILDIADKDPNMQEPGKSFVAIHKEFYKQFYDAALEHTREQLRIYAEFLLKYPDDMEELPEDMGPELERIRDDAAYREELCPKAA